MLRLSFLLHFRFRQKRIQLSEYLTYPHLRGFTVTDSRGLSPTFLLPFGTAKDCNHLEFSPILPEIAGFVNSPEGL